MKSAWELISGIAINVSTDVIRAKGAGSSLCELSRATGELRDQVSRDGNVLSIEGPGFDVAHKDEREEQLLFVPNKRTAGRLEVSTLLPRDPLGTFHGTLVLSANVHSWRINRARPHAFNNGRHAYNRPERRVLPGAVALPCLPLSARKARFRAKADKSFRDGQETGIAMNAI